MGVGMVEARLSVQDSVEFGLPAATLNCRKTEKEWR
jgi:hypothetical protein